MREQTKTKVRGYVAAIIVLAVLVGVLAVGYIGSSATLSTYATQLENSYQRSIYELVSDVNRPWLIPLIILLLASVEFLEGSVGILLFRRSDLL